MNERIKKTVRIAVLALALIVLGARDAKTDVGTLLVGNVLDRMATMIANLDVQMGMATSHLSAQLNLTVANLRLAYRDELGLSLDKLSNERRAALIQVQSTIESVVKATSRELGKRVAEIDESISSIQRSLGSNSYWINAVRGTVYSTDTSNNRRLRLKLSGRGVGDAASDYRSEVEVWVNGRNAVLSRSSVGTSETEIDVDRDIVAFNSMLVDGIHLCHAVLKVKYLTKKKYLFVELGTEYAEITIPIKLVGYGNVIGEVSVAGVQPVFVLKYQRTETREEISTDDHCRRNCEDHVGQTNCWSWATSNPDEILYDATMRCIDGPCEFNREYPPQLTNNNRGVRWCCQSRTRPTRWRMTVNVGVMSIDYYESYQHGVPITTTEPMRIRIPKNVSGVVVRMRIQGVGVVQFGIDETPAVSGLRVVQNETLNGERHITCLFDPSVLETL